MKWTLAVKWMLLLKPSNRSRSLTLWTFVNTKLPRLDDVDTHFTYCDRDKIDDGIFKFISVNKWKLLYLIQMSLIYDPKSQIDNKPALVQIMAWRQAIIRTNDWIVYHRRLTKLFCKYVLDANKFNTNTGLILGLRSANERRRYLVSPSFPGWAQT